MFNRLSLECQLTWERIKISNENLIGNWIKLVKLFLRNLIFSYSHSLQSHSMVEKYWEVFFFRYSVIYDMFKNLIHLWTETPGDTKRISSVWFINICKRKLLTKNDIVLQRLKPTFGSLREIWETWLLIAKIHYFSQNLMCIHHRMVTFLRPILKVWNMSPSPDLFHLWLPGSIPLFLTSMQLGTCCGISVEYFHSDSSHLKNIQEMSKYIHKYIFKTYL